MSLAHAIEPDKRANRPLPLNSLTGLRALAALIVFVGHAGLPVPAKDIPFVAEHIQRQGGSGVAFFFVLSGFVMTYARRPGSVLNFYRRRFARIYPVYALSLITGLVFLHLSNDPLPSHHAIKDTFFLVQAWDQPALFAVNGPAWSLSVEAFFYLVFPIAIWLFAKFNKWQSWALLAVALIATQVTPFVLQINSDPALAQKLFSFPPYRFAEFATGIAIALLIGHQVRLRVPMSVALVVAIVVYAIDGWVPGSYAVTGPTAIAFALLVFAAAEHDLSGKRSWLASRPMVMLGQWSFAFYLFHMIGILQITPRIQWLHTQPPLVVWSSALLLCIAISAVVYNLFEKPVEKLLRGKQTRKTVDDFSGRGSTIQLDSVDLSIADGPRLRAPAVSGER